jgi:hypothetical protein
MTPEDYHTKKPLSPEPLILNTMLYLSTAGSPDMSQWAQLVKPGRNVAHLSLEDLEGASEALQKFYAKELLPQFQKALKPIGRGGTTTAVQAYRRIDQILVAPLRALPDKKRGNSFHVGTISLKGIPFNVYYANTAIYPTDREVHKTWHPSPTDRLISLDKARTLYP